MTELKQIYRCAVCGNVVEVVRSGAGTLVCCGQEMILESVHSQDEGQEKHLPVIEKNGSQVTVKIGSIPHPMTPEHFLEWVEIQTSAGCYRQILTPTSQPQAVFTIPEAEQTGLVARVYCNLHGLWQTVAE